MKNNRSITPTKAIEILREHGTELTFEEAEAVLDLMYKFADITARQMKNTDQNPLPDKLSTDE